MGALVKYIGNIKSHYVPHSNPFSSICFLPAQKFLIYINKIIQIKLNLCNHKIYVYINPKHEIYMLFILFHTIDLLL